MEVPQGLFVLLVAFLTSPKGSTSQIHITPKNPIIKLHSTLTLNCSSSCASGKVKWKSMQDSMLAKSIDHGHYSIMVLQNITEEHTSFICEEMCNKKNSRTVKLYHFSGPTLTTDPEQPETGQPFQLICKVKINPKLSYELTLKHGSRVLVSQGDCGSYSSALLDCDVSATETNDASEAQYECEATLRKDSSERKESAHLALILREAAATTDPPKRTSTILPSEPPTTSTAAMTTETVPVQTMQPNSQSSSTLKTAATTDPPKRPPTMLPSVPATASTAAMITETVTVHPNSHSSSAFKKSAAVRSSSSSSSSSSAAAAAEQENPIEKSSSTVWLCVIVGLVLLALIIIAVFFFLRKKRKEVSASEERRSSPHQ